MFVAPAALFLNFKQNLAFIVPTSLNYLPALNEALSTISDAYFYVLVLLTPNHYTHNRLTPTTASYTTASVEMNDVTSQAASLLQESTDDQRFMRLTNPVFQYDFKVGNYMPDDIKKMNPHLFNTIKDITTGLRKSS